MKLKHNPRTNATRWTRKNNSEELHLRHLSKVWKYVLFSAHVFNEEHELRSRSLKTTKWTCRGFHHTMLHWNKVNLQNWCKCLQVKDIWLGPVRDEKLNSSVGQFGTWPSEPYSKQNQFPCTCTIIAPVIPHLIIVVSVYWNDYQMP